MPGWAGGRDGGAVKIAFFTENGYAGGLDTFVTNLINNWPDASDELVLICNRSHPGLEMVAENLRRPCRVVGHAIPLQWVFMQKLLWLPGVIRKPLSATSKYLFFLAYMPLVARLLKTEAPDRLMIVNGGYPGGDTNRAAAIVWGAFFGKEPSIHNFHNLAFAPRWWERPIENLIDRLVERYSKSILSTSHASAETIRLRPAIAASTKIGFIHNGTEDPPQPDPDRKRIKQILEIPESSPVISMLGTYEPRKGHRFLLEAFKKIRQRVPAAHLVITGYGSEEEIKFVADAANELGLGASVHLEGFWIDRHELMEETTVVVVSSQGFESFGLTLVEAMSHKVPVVSTRVGGTPEVMNDDEGGFSVERTDLEGFAEKICLLLEDSALRRAKGEGGYRRFRDHFTIKRMAAAYAEAIHDGPPAGTAGGP